MKPLSYCNANLNDPLKITSAVKPLKLDSSDESFAHFALDDLSYIEFASESNPSDQYTVGCASTESFHLLYCEEGTLEIIHSQNYRQTLQPFDSSLIYSPEGGLVHVRPLSGSKFHFYLMSCNQPCGAHTPVSTCYERYKAEFLEIMPENYPIYTGQPCLKIAGQMRNLASTANDNAASVLRMHGLMYEIFAMKLEQMGDILKKPWFEYGSLTQHDIKMIRDTAEYILENPSREYTIDGLCRYAGLSPAKLQEGFKKMYGNTAINFIRDARLEKATELIQTTDLNISEIVYSIGLTSRSYFSKIFKHKYRCSPKFFQERQRSVPRIVR